MLMNVMARLPSSCPKPVVWLVLALDCLLTVLSSQLED